ncbi:uncharacterized protein LOC143594074 [Bidens hawaiensis]|uniref:uncharacterized protein LOC143594074 n=1 Tax=Bidens hawaiensis TaxID=980011 RepID=UPI00404A8F76
MARDCFQSNPHVDLKLRHIAKRNKDGRTYNLPTASEVAALVVGDIDTSLEPRDIIVKTKEGFLQRIKELHPSYVPLQYRIIFIYGNDCYRIDIPHRDVSGSNTTKTRLCIMREFFCYMIQDRLNHFSLILQSRRLFQQSLVDAYTMIESERLFFIHNQQKKLRCETYENLRFVQNQGKNDQSTVGQRVILPSSFTGSARYMLQNYLDAMSLYVYTVEFQKCGLPHVHLCLFMNADHKLPTVEYIDPFISAEIPDKKLDPKLYYLVREFMIHGPCGIANKNCPCMIGGKCSKDFPKKFHEFTSIDGDGYPVKDPTTFSQIRTVNSVEYLTFRDACYACVLLDDDNEYVEAIVEASFTGTGYYLRSLFCTLLMSKSMSRPEFVWETTWTYLSDDILYKQRIVLKHPGLELNEEQVKNLTLFEIEKFLLRNNSTLKKFSTMPFSNKDSISSANNLLLSEELAYDNVMLAQEFEQLFSSFTNEQHSVYEEIIVAVDKNKGVVFFVYGYSGTGKTYIWKTLCASIRSQGKIILSVASSGIASLLLSGGRTAHSRFHIPINLVEDSFCYINPDSDLAYLLRETSLIIWDEAPMVHKHGFEALDRSLKDILSFFKFTIWWKGEGNVSGTNDVEAQIEIPEDFLIRHSCDPVSELIDFVYPSVLQNFKKQNYFHERAILAPKNDIVQEINDRLLSIFPGEEREYLCFDSVCPTDMINENLDESYPLPTFLMELKH